MTPTIIASLTTIRAAGKLRWYAGMLTTRHGRVLRIETHRYDDGAVFTALFVPFLCDDADEMAIPDDDAIPDTDDPVTAAAFLLMAREVRRDPGFCVRFVRDFHLGTEGWVGIGTSAKICGPVTATYATEIEALIAAILAAPEKA